MMLFYDLNDKRSYLKLNLQKLVNIYISELASVVLATLEHKDV